MRLKARVAAVLAAGTTFVCVAPASAQQTPLPTCADFPTQVDMENSVSAFADPGVLDPDGDGVGCEDNPAPPVAYNMQVFPPVPITQGPPLEVSPTSGPVGTVITVHGEGCDPPGGQRVDVDLVDQNPRGFAVAFAVLSIDDGGSWSAELTVPAGIDPDHAYAVIAYCHIFEPPDVGPVLVVRYDAVPFDVTEPTTSPPVAPPPPAPPAQPVVATPTFTG